MQIGYNNDVEFRGKTFHIQTEDRGLKAAKIETQVFQAGAILDTAIIPYAKQIDGVEGDDRIAKIRDMMKAAHKNFYKKIQAGEYNEMVGLAPESAPAEVDVDAFDPGQDRVPSSALEMEKNPEAFAIDPGMGEAVDISKLKERLGSISEAADAPSPTMMVTPEEIQAAMLKDAEQVTAPVRVPAPKSSSPLNFSPTGAQAWKGCQPMKEDVSITSLVEAFLAG